MKLPVPETRYGWLASVIVVVTVFSLYYGGVYRLFYDYYKSQYIEARIMKFTIPCGLPESDWQEELLTTPTAELPLATLPPVYEPSPTATLLATDGETNENKIVCMEQKWSLILQMPKYVSYATPGWIYFELKNLNTVPQDVALVINFSGEKLSLLPSMYDSETFVRVINQKQVAAGATLYGRIYFGGNHIQDKEVCDALIKNAFFINGYMIDTQVEANITCPQNDIQKSFDRSVVENLLLPPWANTLIPAISLFVCFLFDSPSKNQRANQSDSKGSDENNPQEANKADKDSDDGSNLQEAKQSATESTGENNPDQNSKSASNSRDEKKENIFSFIGKAIRIYTFSMVTIVITGFLMIYRLLASLENPESLVPEETISETIWIATVLFFLLGSILLIYNYIHLRHLFQNHTNIGHALEETKAIDNIKNLRSRFQKK